MPGAYYGDTTDRRWVGRLDMNVCFNVGWIMAEHDYGPWELFLRFIYQDILAFWFSACRSNSNQRLSTALMGTVRPLHLPSILTPVPLRMGTFSSKNSFKVVSPFVPLGSTMAALKEFLAAASIKYAAEVPMPCADHSVPSR